jgi:predicted SprT family Zn-dependent metalloprotease
MKATSTPTNEIYKQIEQAYSHFNAELFNGQLPNCLITVQREKNTMGYFSPMRWSNNQGKQAHEIALNPAYFAGHPVIEVFQTLVHEQCHLWQHEYGKPSQTSYHNKEWSKKMESLGLIPSDTGRPGGAKTGQKMADYPDPGGLFENACVKLIESGYKLSWVDRRVASSVAFAAPMLHSIVDTEISNDLEIEPNAPSALEYLAKPVEQVMSDFVVQPTVAMSKHKTKYTCPECGSNVWGKPKLNIDCGDCKQPFQMN